MNSLRVMVIGNHIFPDAFEWHIVDTFRSLGHDVQFFEAAQNFGLPRGIARRTLQKLTTLALREPERLYEKGLLRAIHAFEPALVLVTLGSQLSPKTVTAIRALSKVPIACWCQDQMTTLGRQYLLGAGYDAVFVKDRHMKDLFSRMIKSTAFHYLPEACNPRVHRSLALNEKERKIYACDVMLAGTLYYYRQEILRQLTEVDLKVWGLQPDWLVSRGIRHGGREVEGDDKARAVAGARISLNTLHYGEVDGLNARAFEVAGCGGFQMISAVPVLAEHFAIGEELVAFNSSTELIELIRHYLDRPDETAAIAMRGQQRAHREHTYEHRLQAILDICLGPQTDPPGSAVSRP